MGCFFLATPEKNNPVTLNRPLLPLIKLRYVNLTNLWCNLSAYLLQLSLEGPSLRLIVKWR